MIVLHHNTNDTASDVIPNDMTASAFHEWVAVDMYLETSSPVTKDDVCLEILSQKLGVNEDISDDEWEIQLPFNKEINAAPSVLRREMQCRGNSTDL